MDCLKLNLHSRRSSCVKMVLSLIVLLVVAQTAMAGAPWDNGKIVVSENGRYLQHENGKPFFWQGDTAWLLFQRLDRDQVVQYFEDRGEKGFNVVQCIFVQNHSHVNAYGDAAYANEDVTQPLITEGNDPGNPDQYDYFDHVDYIVEIAAKNGIYVAIVPTWRDLLKQQGENLTKEKTEKFGAYLANHFKNNPNIIWVNGGSSRGDQYTDIWETLGATIKKNDPEHLMTFHPFGRMQTSTWYQNTSWLDLNMFSSGHRNYEQDNKDKKYGEDNWRYVVEDLLLTPVKPTLDAEPSYENLPEGIHDASLPYWKASDARRYAYWSVLAGACGHVYGENSVRQVHIQGVNKAESGAKLTFSEALDAPGAFQMQYVKNLVLSRPYFDRVNDQSAVAGDEGEKYDRILVSRGDDYLMAYTYTGREFTVQMGKISGKKVNAWWYDTRTGQAHLIGKFANTGSKSFDPPGVKHNGNDWVLVLDNASKKFNAPGVLTK